MSRALIDEFQENWGEIARAKNEKKNLEIHEIVHDDWNVTIHVCWLFVFRYLIEFQICFSCVTIFIHNKTSPNTHTNGVVVRAITLCFWPSWGDEGWSTSLSKWKLIKFGILCLSLCDSVTTIQIIQFKCTWQRFIPPPLLHAVPWNMRVQSLRLVASLLWHRASVLWSRQNDCPL